MIAPGLKSRWGRGGVLTVTAGAGWRSAGTRSLLLAGVAMVLVVGSIAFFGSRPDEAGSAWGNLGTIVALMVFVVAAPVLLVMALIAGLRGLFGAGGGRIASAFGLLFSLGLLGLCILVVMLGIAGAGRVP